MRKSLLYPVACHGSVTAHAMTSTLIPGQFGEFNLPPSPDDFYLLGAQVTRLNTAGLLLRPGFQSDLVLRANSGGWAFVSTHHVAPQAFAPERRWSS